MSVRRVAVLEAIAHLGGAQISLLELVRRLEGSPRMILILPEDGPLRQKAIEAGADVHILPWPTGLMRVGERTSRSAWTLAAKAPAAIAGILGLRRRLAHLLDDIRADVLLTNGIKPHIIGAIAQLGSQRPLMWYLRDCMEGRAASTSAMQLLASRCRSAIAISRFVGVEARMFLPAKTPVHVIYNLIDFEKFRPDATPAADLKKKPDEVWFAVIGAITPLKGQDIFLKAAAEVARRIPAARFLIIGGNFYRTDARSPFEAQLRRLAAIPALAGRVDFLGQREDIASVLRRVDIVVQPNRGPEALGRSILESMAVGVPVISIDRWGPAELIQHGVTGITVPTIDVPALVMRMIQLGTDHAGREKLGQAAQRWVHQRCDPYQILDQFRSAIDLVC